METVLLSGEDGPEQAVAPEGTQADLGECGGLQQADPRGRVSLGGHGLEMWGVPAVAPEARAAS